MYFEKHNEYSNPTLKYFKSSYLKKHDELQAISNIVNAYKHCIRGTYKRGKFTRNESTLHASDLAESAIYFTVGMPVGRRLVELQYSFNGMDSEKMLKPAFTYWITYLNKADNKNA